MLGERGVGLVWGAQRAERNFKQVSPAPPAGWEQGGLYIYQALALGKVEQGWPGLLLKYY